RLSALGQEAQLPTASSGAGSELLGETWPVVLGEFNKKWRSNAQWDWMFEHLRFKHQLAPLLAADAATAAQWPAQERLARARALRAMAPAEELAELCVLHAGHPDDAAITLAYGAALLNEEDAAGAALLENLALNRPTFRVPVYLRLANYYART